MRQNQRIIYALSCRNRKRERGQESERVRKREDRRGKGKEKKERKRKRNFQTVSVLNEEIYVCIYMRESSYPDLNFNSTPYPNSSLGRPPDYARNSTSLICAILRIISVIQ